MKDEMLVKNLGGGLEQEWIYNIETTLVTQQFSQFKINCC